MQRANRGPRRFRRRALALALVLAVAAAAAATWGAAASASQEARHGTRAIVKLRKTSLGKVLVDRRGRTLYFFGADKRHKSSCYGACATAWPPLLTTGKPIARGGVRANLLGTSKRRDGKLQVTYRGHPLYAFVEDRKAGQTSGEGLHGFGGAWYALDRAGKKVEQAMHGSGGSNPPPPATTTSSGGYGY